MCKVQTSVKIISTKRWSSREVLNTIDQTETAVNASTLDVHFDGYLFIYFLFSFIQFLMSKCCRRRGGLTMRAFLNADAFSVYWSWTGFHYSFYESTRCKFLHRNAYTHAYFFKSEIPPNVLTKYVVVIKLIRYLLIFFFLGQYCHAEYSSKRGLTLSLMQQS